MSGVLHFEELAIGDSWSSRSRTITETDVVNFAGMTGDYDPLHVDHDFAERSPFGRPIAHGLLGLSFVAGLCSQSPAVNTMAFVSIRDWEFLAPAYIGDTVHATTEVIGKEPNGRRTGRVIWKRRLINQNGEVIQAGVLETLVALRDCKRNRIESPTDSNPAPHIALHKGEHSPPSL